MEYTIQLDEEHKIVIAVPRGEWELETDNMMIHEILATVDTTDAQKVLLDIRELHLNLTIIEIFEHAKVAREMRQRFTKVSRKVALVYSAVDPKLEEDMLFFETTVRNRGLPYKVFKDIDAAWAWLLEA